MIATIYRVDTSALVPADSGQHGALIDLKLCSRDGIDHHARRSASASGLVFRGSRHRAGLTVVSPGGTHRTAADSEGLRP